MFNGIEPLITYREPNTYSNNVPSRRFDYVEKPFSTNVCWSSNNSFIFYDFLCIDSRVTKLIVGHLSKIFSCSQFVSCIFSTTQKIWAWLNHVQHTILLMPCKNEFFCSRMNVIRREEKSDSLQYLLEIMGYSTKWENKR